MVMHRAGACLRHEAISRSVLVSRRHSGHHTGPALYLSSVYSAAHVVIVILGRVGNNVDAEGQRILLRLFLPLLAQSILFSSTST